ncbi:hypothetical protein [Legionella parisiensis]|uniref:Uncharacterized protein n=1 Tax=Legionella parisiensis TaxID=45071 RepID=A0A1E5JPS8_9GAMM|nr:hypothetical protein [Legionella parisiensis]KTD44411.1 hypothetical protein Lpar_0497 [Legionella parisiensis]OEH46534.1 hypothetical protein lpari_02475 [Legionella parisiensis]STX72039.1 Uncharacterised protein [Legionella parisiensis]
MQNKQSNEPTKHRKSPPREGLEINKGVTNGVGGINPEQANNPRTIELATDQSITARHLLYYPNEASLSVMEKCADGINCVMARLNHDGDVIGDLAKDEILISMCTRLMADGGTGRIIGFNDRLTELVEMRKHTPKPNGYVDAIKSLANDCRDNMAQITATAKKAGPEGALARQGILSFMGDLGGIEKHETGFGAAYKGPLCEPQDVYNTYVAGLCDAQRKLKGQTIPAIDSEVSGFEIQFHKAREQTSLKGGGLSAPAHTARKKEERAPIGWKVQERHGLLNTGDFAEDKLKEIDLQHTKTLVDAAWPSYLVSEAVTKDVVEPVTGHVSGTFGEMAVTMDLFCGTPPESIDWKHPSGTPISSAHKDQVTAIGALAAAGLITAGFHSAVEIFQPISTFTTHPTHGSLGPKAVVEMNLHAQALRRFAEYLAKYKDKPGDWVQYSDDGQICCILSLEELNLSKEEVLSKAQSIEDAATKSVDMISALQGEGGTIATLELCRVLANHSTDPKRALNLCSLNTRLEQLGLRGYSPELKAARDIATEPVNDTQQKKLKDAIDVAEQAADRREAAIKIKPAGDEQSSYLLSALQSTLGKFAIGVGIAVAVVGTAFVVTQMRK